MNKLSLAAKVLPIVAIISLLSIAAILKTGNGQISLGGEMLTETTPATYSNLLWLSPVNNGAADVAEWEQNPICVDAGAWEIRITGQNKNSVSWRETPDKIVITILGTLPDSNDTPTSAPIH